MIPEGFKGRALRLKEIDIPLTARRIGTGKDELRAVMEVETAGGGFDKLGRPRMLFEPHVFYRELGPTQKRTAAEAQGLAYPRWGAKKYPADSYPRLALAMKLDPQAALRSASWGLGQIMAFNHKAAGFASADEMVAAFCDREAAQLEGMVAFIASEGLGWWGRRCCPPFWSGGGGGIVPAFLLARLSLAAKSRLGLDIEKQHQDALHSALMSGVRAALQRGSVVDAVVSEAISYAQSSVPDAIAKLSSAGGVLAQLARAKIDEIARAGTVRKLEVALPANLGPRRRG